MAGAVHRACRRTGWTRGRRWPAAACHVDFVAGTALEPEVQISWQAQCAEPAGGLGGRAVAAGPRLPVVPGTALGEPEVQISQQDGFSLLVLMSLTCGVIRSFYFSFLLN